MPSQHDPAHFALEKLSDAGLALADPSQDTRGRLVVDCDGVRLGHVSGIFIDVWNTRKVRLIEMRRAGGVSRDRRARHFVLPIEVVRAVTADEVRVGETRDRILASPVYDPMLVEPPTSASLQSHYDHYGVTPTWSTGASSSRSSDPAVLRSCAADRNAELRASGIPNSIVILQARIATSARRLPTPGCRHVRLTER